MEPTNSVCFKHEKNTDLNTQCLSLSTLNMLSTLNTIEVWENVMSLSTLNMYDFSLKYTNFAGHPPSPPGGVYIPLLVYLSPFEPMDLKYLRPMNPGGSQTDQGYFLYLTNPTVGLG